MRGKRFLMLCQPGLLIGAAVAGVLGVPGGLMAQSIKDLQTAREPSC